MKKRFRILAIILGLLLLTVFCNPFALSHYYNNWKLKYFAAGLFGLPLPPQTAEVSKAASSAPGIVPY